nr:F-box protein At5g03100-like [Lolium perenne]
MGDNKVAVAGGEDRLSALPDDVIRLFLSFLPSRQAVQTCVLATRWRTLWKSVPSLRIDMRYDSAKFLNSLIRYRDPTPLRECDILFVHRDYTSEARREAELWLRYALSCKARLLRFDILNHFIQLSLSAGVLVSKYLTSLNLCGVVFEDFSLDVLGCKSLEVLDMHDCVINIGAEFPKSLRLLRIRDARCIPEDTRSSIHAPGLIILELADPFGWTPVLKRLPSLVTAFINIGYDCMDSCRKSSYGDCGHQSCMACYGVLDNCVLLQGLSGATNLELITPSSMIFRKEIKWCPMFSKLKALLLGDWCMTSNFSGLVYFLQHSPVLEMLTLQLSGFNKKSIIKTSVYKPKEQFVVTKHLKAVKITYFKEKGMDERAPMSPVSFAIRYLRFVN